MEKKNKRNKVLKIIGILGLLVLVFGLSYALFTITLNGTKKVKISTGTLSLRLLDENDNYVDDLNNNADIGYDIELVNAVPEKDADAFHRTQITSLRVPASVTTIGSFGGNEYLEELLVEGDSLVYDGSGGSSGLRVSNIICKTQECYDNMQSQDLSGAGSHPNIVVDPTRFE